MNVFPCSLCGYDAPGGDPCPHCQGAPQEASLRRRLGGPLTGLVDGLLALPMGFRYLMTTGRVKRWLLPPLILTTAVLVAVLWWTFTTVNGWMDKVLPEGVELGGRAWLDGLGERWSWITAAWAALVGAAEWALNLGWGFLMSQPLRFLTWFLLGSLVMWYCFSIAYEAFAGPFLDEIQARLEVRWFGGDPRSRLERPNDIPVARCIRLTTLSCLGAGVVFLVLVLVPGPPWWLAVLACPLAFAPAALADARYRGWLVWVAHVEARATWASLQAAVFTGVLLLIALPLFFVPVVGYFLFAGVAGFATAVGLLDIAMERRLWSLGQRLRFVGRNLPAMLAFGVMAGLLLAVPVLGPVLMVPSASLGGLWLVCRLHKGHLRPPGAP